MNEEKIPQLGRCVDGRMLVMTGDEVPEEMVPWLEQMLEQFESLQQEAEILSCEIPWHDASDFFEEIGIEIERSDIESAYGLGRFLTGWIDKGQTSTVRMAARRVLRLLGRRVAAERRAYVRDKVRQIRARLAAVDEAGELVGWELTHRSEAEKLRQEISRLRKEQEAARSKIRELEAAAIDSRARAGRLAAFLKSRTADRNIVRACGPFLAAGSTLFVLTDIGGGGGPGGTVYGRAIELLRGAGCAMDEVKEATVTGTHWRGRSYRTIGGSEGQWERAWQRGRQEPPRTYLCSSASQQQELERALKRFFARKSSHDKTN